MKILCVEDNQEILDLVYTILKQDGHAVDTCDNGQDAFNKACMNTYDLIILDYNLPCKNGYEVCKSLRSINVSSYIIFLTIKNALKDKLDCLRIGGDEYMKKPFSNSELIEKVNTLSRRPKKILSNPLFYKNLKLDINSKRAFFLDKNVNLTKKEFTILYFLIINKDIVVSRDLLLEKMWDNNIDPLSNVVEVYISKIKNKLKEKTGQSFIKNSRGVGYYVGNVN
jgi:DNA-binding response OmpR family regulator